MSGMAPPRPLPRALHDALTMAAAAMQAAEDDWWVIGSAAVALLGAAPADVADVDVLLSAADMGRVAAALGIAPRPGAPNGLFRSALFARWAAPPLAVEFMSGLEVNAAGGGWLAVAPQTRLTAPVGEARLFTPDRAELQRILATFGRPKDHARAALLGR